MAGKRLYAIAAVWASMTLAGAVPGAEPYRPAGGTGEPKVPIAWNRYNDHKEVTGILERLAKAFPEQAKLHSLGKSHGGRDMWILTVTNFRKGDEKSKPGFWIDGSIHANEIQCTEVVLYTAWYLLEMAPRNPRLQELLDTRVFYLCPIMSPDSRDAHLHKPNTTHSPRSGQRPIDDDLDGLLDEDGPDDLDGDGNIAEMRIADPHGKWKKHPEHPYLMTPIKPGEKGEYTLLGTEGFDNDDDGLVNEDGDGRYDPNRDWGWNWQPDYVQNGAHRYPFSFAENRLVAEFVRSKPNIAGAQSYHNTGGMILRGPGAKDDRYDPADVAVYDRLGKHGEKVLPGYRYINIANDLYEVYGGEIDWLHGMRGAYTFTNELFTPFNFFRRSTGGAFFATPDELHEFDKHLLLGDGFRPWQEFKHPQHGKVEIGGFTKNWQRQPPSFLLEEECHRNAAFTFYCAEQLPKIDIAETSVRSLGGGLREITAVIRNANVTPTRSAADVDRRLTPPDIAYLTGDKTRVIAGWTSREPLFRTPAAQAREPARLKLDRVPGEGVIYVRWLISGELPPAVRFESVKGGIAEKAIPPAAGP